MVMKHNYYFVIHSQCLTVAIGFLCRPRRSASARNLKHDTKSRKKKISYT